MPHPAPNSKFNWTNWFQNIDSFRHHFVGKKKYIILQARRYWQGQKNRDQLWQMSSLVGKVAGTNPRRTLPVDLSVHPYKIPNCTTLVNRYGRQGGLLGGLYS